MVYQKLKYLSTFKVKKIQTKVGIEIDTKNATICNIEKAREKINK